MGANLNVSLRQVNVLGRHTGHMIGSMGAPCQGIRG